MDAQSANRALLKGQAGVRLRPLSRIKRRSIILNLNDKLRRNGKPDFDFVRRFPCKSMAHQIREVFLQGEVSRVDDARGKTVFAAKLLQCLDNFASFARLSFQDDFQGGPPSQDRGELSDLFH